jgi:hypothetical protein
MMKKLLLALGVLLPWTALADSQGTTSVVVYTTSTGSQNLINVAPLDGAAGTRTITLTTGKRFSTILVTVIFDGTGTSTAITATPTCSQDGTNFASVTSRAIAAGVGTVSPFTDVRTTSVTENYLLDYDVRGCEKYKIVFSGTTPSAADLLTVQAVAVVGE